MENVNGPTLRESRRAALGLLCPIVHLLKISGIAEDAFRSAWEQACRAHPRTAARGVWLNRACFLQLADLVRVWARDPEFIDETGSPRRLRLAGGVRQGRDSFAYLIKKARVSIEARSALERLQALRAVQRCNRGRRVRLVSDVLPGVAGSRFLAAPMLDAVRRLAETVEHNVCAQAAAAQGRMHRWVGCASLDARQLGEVQRFLRLSGQAFLDAADEKLLSCSRKRTGRRRLYGVGLYVFVDRAGKPSGRQPRERCASG